MALTFRGNFIDGRFRRAASGVRRFVSENPGDLSRPVGVCTYSVKDVDAAVRAAREASPGWARLDPKRRLRYILRFQHALRKRLEPLARIIMQEMGKTLAESRVELDRLFDKVQIARGYESRLTASWGHRVNAKTMAYCRYRPRGVMAILAPFNVPAYLATAQTISALHTGNTVIVKPSELTPFVGQALAALWRDAGLPKGVFNLVQGPGDVGKRLVAHPDINGVLFTGSWETGLRIQKTLLKEPHKLCAAEMGGKNAAIIAPDAQLKEAVEATAIGAFLTTGQRCNATSRIIVDRRIANRFVSAFLARVDQLRVGYGADPSVFMGPVVSRRNRDAFLSHVRKASREGFETLRSGGPLTLSRKGYYLKPSVHLTQELPRTAIAESSYKDREVLGPDTAIYVVKNLEEAIELNNRPRYGLVTTLFSRSKTHYLKVLAAAETGLVHWNVATTRSSARLPFGGLKQSGNDRPAGFFTPYLCTIPTTSVERGPDG